MRRVLEFGGLVAGIVLIGFGCVVIVLGLQGRSTVSTELQRQHIVGSGDMTPAAIRDEARKAGLTNVDLPTCSVAGQSIDTGSEARCFAEYMRIHALEASGGQTYAQMPRYLTPGGQGTNDAAQAKKGPNGSPVDNPARNVWVTETALSTALNVSYMADQLSLFTLVVGIALLLTGIGFLVLDWFGLGRRGASRPQPA